jgi:hypothetical protein
VALAVKSSQHLSFPQSRLSKGVTGLFLSFQLSALSFQLLGRGQFSFSEQGVKGGYEMIVRQGRVILCKSWAEKTSYQQA